MKQEGSLAGKFLIAMPTLTDPNFERAVLLVCSHTREGALGLVINQLHSTSMREIVQQLDMTWQRKDCLPQVFQGGPVALDRGFILFEQLFNCTGCLQVEEGLYLGTNPEILRRLLSDETSGRFMLALGYSGWASGQLEAELRSNIWLVSAANRQILFDAPADKRWNAAIGSMGIDWVQLVDVGNSIN
ncbi:MAG: YqgE/AlgH family protein [Magnetococcales bacterium]|nr:YqgE/AlgH family protein [Magnetococcales bacterium]MBF0439703.1 YqgE/AlgH family protein [Magnetococcales bacterium]